MSLDVAESLIAHRAIDPDELAVRFSRSYRWSRGYGPGAARILKRIARGDDWRTANTSVYPGGSFGNGASMRAPVLGLFYAGRPDELATSARASAVVTHAHPLGIEGAVLIATATATAMTGDPSQILEAASSSCEQDAFTERLEIARTWLRSEPSPPPVEVARALGNRTTAAESCVTATYAALRFLGDPFGDLLAFVAACGGDVDTIGAMAGAIWGAANGAARLPRDLIRRLEAHDRLSRVAGELYGASTAE